jgi:uncharacterized protein (DUF427 family)
MKPIGPDHPITVRAYPRRVRALFHGHLIADSDNVLELREAGYKPVFYFPRDDVAMDYLMRGERTTHCPYKGDAHYYGIRRDGEIVDNAVWTYEQPYDQMNAIASRLAFYPNMVEFHEIDEHGNRIEPNDEMIREAVLHTDSGSGASQKEHWPPNVSEAGP